MVRQVLACCVASGFVYVGPSWVYNTMVFGGDKGFCGYLGQGICLKIGYVAIFPIGKTISTLVKLFFY
jgi:hypothetical protein